MAAASRQTTSRRPVTRRLGGALLAAGLVTLGACTPNIDNRGNLPAKERLAAVKAGTTTRAQVQRLLGSPSTIAALKGNTWYYISKTEERFAFITTKVHTQQVIEISFNDAGVVQRVRRYTLKDAKDVRLAERETPTRVDEPGLIRSLYDTLTRGPFGSRQRPGRGQGVER